MKYYNFFILYLIIINFLSVIITVYDKYCAVHNKWRVKELTLLFFSCLGGSVFMYITMLIIRHKTKKPKFMVGIPFIFILQIIIYVMVNQYVI